MDYQGIAIGIFGVMLGVYLINSAVNEMLENDDGWLFDIFILWASAWLAAEIKKYQHNPDDKRGESLVTSRRKFVLY